jgi:hypothetical protein
VRFAMRIISMILIVVISCSCPGCYNTILVSKHDEIRMMLNEKAALHKLTMQNSERYSFLDHQYDYVFKNDTIYGRAKMITSEPWQKFGDIQFPVNEIWDIEI